MLYRNFIKPLLFLLSPEKAHDLTVSALKFILSLPGIGAFVRSFFHKKHPALERNLFGIRFQNPVGLAAGFDKDGKYFRAMAALGFGFIEIGTVTPKGQSGNPAPRLFRLPADHALINRMGFNNEGCEALVERLKKGRPSGLVIGGNIGKNKDTPNEKAGEDYSACFESLFPYVDYFVVNVSSPNTPNLRALQEKEPLKQLISGLMALNHAKVKPKPILLKIAPDLSESQLDDILEIAAATGLSGIIATNTTISRDGLQTPKETLEAIGPGGLSGRPLKDRSTEVIRYLARESKKKLPIIGVGGIESPEDALEKLDAGADLVQVYSGLIYAGPGLVKAINKAIIARRLPEMTKWSGNQPQSSIPS